MREKVHLSRMKMWERYIKFEWRNWREGNFWENRHTLWEGNVNMDFKEIGLESVHADLSISEWAMLAGFCGYGIDTSDFIQIEFLGSD